MPTDDGFSAPEALPVETQPAETPGFVDGAATQPLNVLNAGCGEGVCLRLLEARFAAEAVNFHG